MDVMLRVLRPSVCGAPSHRGHTTTSTSRSSSDHCTYSSSLMSSRDVRGDCLLMGGFEPNGLCGHRTISSALLCRRYMRDAVM